jgi:hypothetical protein
MLYLGAIQPADGRAATAVWNMNPTASARIDLTNAALTAMQKTKLDVDCWRGLFSRLTKKRTARNRIAHGQIMYDHNAPETRRMYLASPKHDGMGWQYHAEDLETIRQHFLDLAADLEVFGQSTFSR